MSAAPHALRPGQSIGPYEILSALGHGGMGEVYLAHDRRLGRKVALKFLPARFIADQDRLRRFEQEARAASALNHPNILTIYEIGDADGDHFIASEFIDGETLRKTIEDGCSGVERALDTAIQIASALKEAHGAGIIHRDIKPENVMVRRDGYVKVLDFGLAKLTERRDSGSDAETHAATETSPGVIIGTVSYMSPEQARGLSVDERTDLWSLGAVLYELLAGTSAFSGLTTSDILAAVLQQDPRPLPDARHMLYRRADEVGRPPATTATAAVRPLQATITGATFGVCEPADATRALALSRINSPTLFFVPVLQEGALCGDAAEGQKFADENIRRYPEALQVTVFSVPIIRAALALKRSQPAQAIDALRVALPYEVGQPGLYSAYLRGHAYLRLRRLVEATAEFRKVLDHRGWDPLSQLYPLAHLGLARALTMSGDAAGGRRAYQDFLSLWQGADQDLPVLVQAKKEFGSVERPTNRGQ